MMSSFKLLSSWMRSHSGITLINLALLLMLPGLAFGQRDRSLIEEEAIRKPALDYVNGWKQGDTALERAFHPSATRRTIRASVAGAPRDYLEETNISKLALWAKQQSKGKSNKGLRSDIGILDHFFRAAVIKVSTDEGVDYLQEVSLGEEWKIVNVLSEPKGLQGEKQDEDQAIQAVGADYIGGWLDGDVERISRALLPELSKRGVRTDAAGNRFVEHFGPSKLIQWTSSGYYRLPELKKQMRITILDHFGDAAIVKVHWGSAVDYVAAAKVKGQWKAVDIVFDDDQSEHAKDKDRTNEWKNDLWVKDYGDSFRWYW